MKKFFTIIAIAIAFLGNTNEVNAQTNVIVTDPGWAYNHCRDHVLQGDEDLRRGAYNTAEWHYKLALESNRDCPNRKYISDSELNRKLDECHFASQHNGMTPRAYEEQQRRNAQSALVYAVANAVSNRNNNYQNISSLFQPKQQTVELQHYEKDGMSYDTNTDKVHILGIQRTEDATVVRFEYLNLSESTYFFLNKKMYLKDKSTNTKYNVVSSDGIYTNKHTNVDAGESVEFSITFPALPAECHNIDIVEPSSTGWKFYHIAI